MTPDQPTTTLRYRGQACLCVQQGPSSFQIVALEGRVLGRLCWHPRWHRYSFVPEPGTAWNSTSLTEIALWLRRLSREGPPA